MIGLVHNCSTSRTQKVGTNGRKTMSTLLPSVDCLFLPMSAYTAVQNGYDVGSAWNVYFNDGIDVQVGDKLTCSGNSYLVRGVRKFSGFPAVSHIEVAATTENAHA